MQYALPRRTLKWMSKSIAALVLAQILCGSMSLVFADQSQPDPAGTATGDKFSVADAAGNPFVVPEPTDKSAPDYAKSKKDFEEFQAQAAREPLALKLADGVGHTRIATNFSWTLLTGYLVLFMQAGFALLTCGLVRNRLRFPIRRGGCECRSHESWRRPNFESFPDRKRPMGIFGRQGVFLDWPSVRCRQQLLDALRSRVYGDCRIHYRWRDLRADHLLGLPSL